VLRLWSGRGTKVWNGNTYYSGLGLISVEGGGENTDGTTEPLTFSIAWKDVATQRDFVQDALKARTGGIAKYAVGHLTSAGAVIVDPIYLWTGRLSTPVIQEGARSDGQAGTLTIAVTCEEFLADRDRSTRFRITHASQLDFDSSDLGLQYQALLGEQDLKWGDLYYKEEHSP
jgi:hypothetical protein